MAIPQSFIQELLARADVVDIVGRYVQLKKGGANFMGLCPFHGEKSPSLPTSFNLETAVGCARVCRDWRVRQGVTTQWACAHKVEQRSVARQARCNRVHGAVTYQVNVIEAEKVNEHAVFLKFASGQLPFLGLMRTAPILRPAAPRRLADRA